MPTIYGLVSPVTDLVYYVGFTTKEIDVRFNNHLVAPKYDTTKYLLQNGYKPNIKTLETGDHVTKQTEQDWISKLLSEGLKLENRDGVIKYQNRDRTKLTEEEVLYLSKLPEQERYKIIITRILNELPRSSSVPIIQRIKSICEAANI